MVVNAYADERRTALLVHWDGRQLRTAWTYPDLLAALVDARADIRSAVRSLVTRALAAAARARPGATLETVYPAPEGEGGLFAWTVPRVGITRDSEAHFREIAESLGLASGEPLHRRTKKRL